MNYLKPNCDMAIITGATIGITVIDVDNNNHWKMLTDMYGYTKTIKGNSPSGGCHYYFKYDPIYDDILKTSNKSFQLNGKILDIDIRNVGGCSNTA